MTRHAPRDTDKGVILVNVLVALALGSALVVLMLTSQDNLLQTARRAGALAQAQALALGGEATVVIALRLDMQTAPEADHFAEPWAAVQQADVELGTGRFSVTIHDAQAGLNLNGLVAGGIVQQSVLARLVAALDLPADTAAKITNQMLRDGPLLAIGDLTDLDAVARAALAGHISFLPDGGAINLNTADATVMAAVLQNRTAALRLVAVRDKAGFVTGSNLTDLGLIATAGAGFRSAVFDVTVVAQVDDVTVTLTSRLLRQTGVGTQQVLVTSRHFGPVADTLPTVPADLLN